MHLKNDHSILNHYSKCHSTSTEIVNLSTLSQRKKNDYKVWRKLLMQMNPTCSAALSSEAKVKRGLMTHYVCLFLPLQRSDDPLSTFRAPTQHRPTTQPKLHGYTFCPLVYSHSHREVWEVSPLANIGQSVSWQPKLRRLHHLGNNL